MRLLHPAGRPPWRGLIVAALALAALAMALPSEAATISEPAGPLLKIHVSSVQALDCQVQVAGVNYQSGGAESDGEFWGYTDGTVATFPEGVNACGTFLRQGAVTYGPNVGGFSCPQNCPNPAPTPFTPITQSAVGGQGSAADPWTLVTAVKAGPGGSVDLVQTDQYVTGDGFYTTTIQVSNTGPADSFSVYRAGDCYLENVATGDNGDQGYGWRDPATNGVACTFAPNVLGSHYIAWFPVSVSTGVVAGEENYWDAIWNRPGQGAPMGNSCLCAVQMDNGAGLSWTFSLAQGANATFVMRNGFVPQPPLPPVPQAPVAAFTLAQAFASGSCIGNTVQFHDTSTDADDTVVSWLWRVTLGADEFISTDSDPTIAFPGPGLYAVALTVTDASGRSTTTSREVQVFGEDNCCPAFEPQEFRMVFEGTTVTLRVAAADQDGDGITFALAPGFPQGAEFDPMTGAFTWATGAGDEGHYSLRFSASDGTCAVAQDVGIWVRALPQRGAVKDTDQDGIADSADDCPSVPDNDQVDTDHDGAGDLCDGTPCGLGPTGPAPCGDGEGPARLYASRVADADLDGLADNSDNCPPVANHGQEDLDGDGQGDACDIDVDGDGILDKAPPGIAFDNCPLLANPDQLDVDLDGVGDHCQGLEAARSLVTSEPALAKGTPADTPVLSNNSIVSWLAGLAATAFPAAILLVQLRRRRQARK